MFLGSGICINLHLPLESWEGALPPRSRLDLETGKIMDHVKFETGNLVPWFVEKCGGGWVG